MKTRIFVAAAVASGLVGCQLLLVADRAQCATDADCAAKSSAPLVCRAAVCVASETGPSSTSDAGDDAGVDLTSPWGCLASPPARTPEDRSQILTIRQRFASYSLFDCQNSRPIGGAEVKLCSQRDVTCGSPVEIAVTDCDGYANFKAAYRGFEGYTMISPPRTADDAGTSDWNPSTKKCFSDLFAKELAEGKSGERCAITKDGEGQVVVPLPLDLVPSIIPLIPPPSVSADPSSVIPWEKTTSVLSASTLESMLAVVGKPFREEAGHLIAIAEDCQGDLTAGIAITVTGGIGPDSQVFYTDTQGLPNVNQGRTSENGETGYLNLDPGSSGVNVVSITATRQEEGERVGSYGVLIRAGYISWVEMPPLKN